MIRLLKLSVNEDEILSSEDILSIHLGYFLTHGKVAYSTNTPVAYQPVYVLLTLGNVDDICYLCHVADYAYKEDTIGQIFLEYSPDIYKYENRTTWLLFDSMQKISVDFLDEILSDTTVHDFIKERANNKIIYTK
ncbi:hypothetical protein [Clostridium sp. UBA1056]|uniref:hypothetical protein n=1 Tax=unclassified Clostridium TaxID=2614128 RepID=UPI0032162E27